VWQEIKLRDRDTRSRVQCCSGSSNSRGGGREIKKEERTMTGDAMDEGGGWGE